MEGIELNEDIARGLLEEHVCTTRWGRRGVSEALVLESFREVGASHLSFQSFVETRSVREGEKPYFGGPVSGPSEGKPPNAYAMAVPSIDPFLDQVRSFEVPYTSRVGICDDCNGRGDLGPCRTCNSRRGSLAAQALGCPTCGGTRREPCPRCQCNGRVVRFRQLVVQCATISATTKLTAEGAPAHLIAHAEGATALAVEAATLDSQYIAATSGAAYRGGGGVSPRVQVAIDALMAGVKLPEDAKLLRQRLVVRAVPIHVATYAWGGRQRRFWVLGANQIVHAPDYPVSWARVGLAAVGALAASGAAAFALSL